MVRNEIQKNAQLYIGLFVLVTFSLIAVGLYAQEATKTGSTLPQFLGRNTGQNCPDFDISAHTMRDNCTGLVWSRAQLPTFSEVGDTNPGYTRSEAAAGCSQLQPAGSFRLPTVEEALTLLSVTCDAQGCRNTSPLVRENGVDGSGDLVGPSKDDSFFGGIFWTGNDYNEPLPYKTNPDGTINPDRDYFRSINLLTGEVDSPVFGAQVKLNAWCIMDLAQQVFDQRITGSDTMTTVYNRSCSPSSFSTDCQPLSDLGIPITGCIERRCSSDTTINPPVSYISDKNTCPAFNHIEGATCIADLGPACTPVSGNGIDNANFQFVWQGNVFNGDYGGCSFTGCQNDHHWNPNENYADRCENNSQSGCIFSVTAGAEYASLVDQTNRLWTQDWDFAYPTTELGPLQFGQSQNYDNGWGVCQAQSCRDEGTITQIRGTAPNQYCGCFGDTQTGSDTEYYWDGSTCAPRIERISSGTPASVPYAAVSARTCDGGVEPWRGPAEASGCAWSSYLAETCLEHAGDNGSGGCVCDPLYGDNNNNGITGDSCDRGYLAEYFNNMQLSGTPTVTQTVSDVNFNWGSQSPAAGISSNNFSARFTRVVQLEAVPYQIAVTSDDGVRVYLDNQLLIDNWIDHSATTNTATVQPAAGQHTIRIEYYDNTFDAVIGFSMQRVPVYTAQYFANNNLQGTPAATETVTGIAFDWGTGSPLPSIPSFPVDDFTVRFTATEEFDAGTYRFIINSNNGYRIFVDGNQISQNWPTNGSASASPQTTLSAGQHTIVVEYRERTLDASVNFEFFRVQ